MAAQRLLRGMTLGPYRSTRLISRGGMGEVYEAVDQVLERRAAIKIMSIEHNQGIEAVSFLSMFTLEARALAQIDHPNVVKVYAVGTHDGAPYIAMEYVEGYSLREAIAREVLTVEQALSVFIPLFEALASLHEAGVIHRDIKPANLLIRRDGVVKLVDFGIAVRKGWEGTTASVEMGTPDYTAPEVLAGSMSSSSSDMWSAGAMLFESLVGVKLSHHRMNPRANIEFPEELKDRVPPELRRIIVKLCMADPHSRYSRAEDVVIGLTKLYRSQSPGTILLNQVFKQNLCKLVERVGLLGGPSTTADDKTQVMSEAPVSPAGGRSPSTSRGTKKKKKSAESANAFKWATGLALAGALIYFGYSFVVLKQQSARFRGTAGVGSGQATFVQTPIALLSPAAGRTFTTAGEIGAVDLTWACVDGANNYFVQIGRDSHFSEVTHERRVSECSWVGVAVPAGHYYWRVRAEDNTDTWSEARAIIVERKKSPPAE